LQAVSAGSYGTLMTVFTSVVDAFNEISLPSIVVMMVLPTVETWIKPEAMIVPWIVPPPAALRYALVPTAQ
jgi:hypothetical protein